MPTFMIQHHFSFSYFISDESSMPTFMIQHQNITLDSHNEGNIPTHTHCLFLMYMNMRILQTLAQIKIDISILFLKYIRACLH